ncbi:type III secretion protein SopE2, partial [Pantoea endophytica]
QKLTDLKITLTADEDHTYARQTCDAILASVYSNKKDYFCKEMISRGIDISGFIKEAGNAAQKAGLAGQKNNHDVFIPSGAGANPFVTSVISSAQQKFPRVFLNKNQQASFKQYAEKKISSEVGEICKKLGLITPVDFGLVLDEIASRYISL